MAETKGIIKGEDGKTRCFWHGGVPEYQLYHDREWGRPVADDIRLFEKICLEGFQSGLSWLTILRKRDNFRRAFAGFDFDKVAGFGKKDVTRLLADAGIVRHRGKIESTINNAHMRPRSRRRDGVARRLFLAVRTRSEIASEANRLGDFARHEHHAGVGGAVEGPEKARLELRRPDHRLCLHAGDGHWSTTMSSGCWCRAEAEKARKAFKRPAVARSIRGMTARKAAEKLFRLAARPWHPKRRATGRASSVGACPNRRTRLVTRCASDLQDHPVFEDLQPVVAQRRAGGGDVDDEVGGARRRRALGRAEAFHDPVVGDAVTGEEAPGQADIFGRDRQPPCRAAGGTRPRRRRGLPWWRRRSTPPAPRPPRRTGRNPSGTLIVGPCRRVGHVSSTWSRPVMPRWTAPAPISRAISGADRIGDLDAGDAGDRARDSSARCRPERYPGRPARIPRCVSSCSRPFDGTAMMSGPLIVALRSGRARWRSRRRGSALRLCPMAAVMSRS